MRGLVLALLLLAGCAGPSDGAPLAEAPKAIRWRAVLVAGDPSLPVWDNAARRLATGLEASGRAVPGQVTRLSAQPDPGAARGGLGPTLAAIERLKPGSGEGCLVFLTMHGAPNRGLVFEPGREVLTPDLLDAALVEGCGAAPTLVVASGCFTGNFAVGAMARDNRAVLTAARADRSSFGCGADFELTVFDECLLRALAKGGPVLGVANGTAGCVQEEERRRSYGPPSGPRLHLGPGMRSLFLPPMPIRG